MNFMWLKQRGLNSGPCQKNTNLDKNSPPVLQELINLPANGYEMPKLDAEVGFGRDAVTSVLPTQPSTVQKLRSCVPNDGGHWCFFQRLLPQVWHSRSLNYVWTASNILYHQAHTTCFIFLGTDAQSNSQCNYDDLLKMGPNTLLVGL